MSGFGYRLKRFLDQPGSQTLRDMLDRVAKLCAWHKRKSKSIVLLETTHPRAESFNKRQREHAEALEEKLNQITELNFFMMSGEWPNGHVPCWLLDAFREGE